MTPEQMLQTGATPLTSNPQTVVVSSAHVTVEGMLQLILEKLNGLDTRLEVLEDRIESLDEHVCEINLATNGGFEIDG